MTIAEILTLTNVILTAITLTIVYSNYKHSREKDFQESLYKIKVESYKKIIDQCVEVWQQLDINATPFVQVYDFENKDEWTTYYEKEVAKLLHLGFDIEKTVFRETTFLPVKVMESIFDFSNKCTRFVIIAAHFDTGLIIEKQDELHETFFQVVNCLRADLGIEVIDGSLQKRISEMNNS